jgi:hypothetical protein
MPRFAEAEAMKFTQTLQSAAQFLCQIHGQHLSKPRPMNFPHIIIEHQIYYP